MTSPPSWTTSLPRHRSSSFLDEDIDPNLKQYLFVKIFLFLVEIILTDSSDRITTFLLHHQQCFLELPISSFLDSINLPSDSGGRHPALLNAIYLIACHFSPDRSFVTQEALFLERARQGLLDSLEMAERLDDYQVASSLIACYLLFKGRLLEAHQAASTSARFAVSCGLHQILSSSTAGNAWNQMRGRPLLAPPGDALELAGRVNAFWQAFSVDRSVSAWGDLPFAFLDEEISTYWPVPCDAATDVSSLPTVSNRSL